MESLKKYEYVIAVAENGGISQAAEALRIAQPTLSKYLKNLEGELGVPLFDRSTIPLRMTAAGERYVEAGRCLIDRERQLRKELEEIKQNRSTVIRVGISPSRSPYMMPAIIEAYRKKNPTGCILIEEKTTTELSWRLARGDLDLIINLLDEETEKFERIELFDEYILLAAANDVAEKESSVIRLLCSVPLIGMGKGQAMGRTMCRLAEKYEAEPPRIECQSIESAFALAKQGLGVTLVPSYIAEFGTEGQKKNVRFLRLPEEEYTAQGTTCVRKVCLFYRRAQFLTEAEKDLITCICDVQKNVKTKSF